MDLALEAAVPMLSLAKAGRKLKERIDGGKRVRKSYLEA